jgi:acetylornithine deacetylase
MRIDAISQRAIEILSTLVAFDSVSRNSNLPLIEWVEAYLDEHGVSHSRAPSPCGTKSNLLACIGTPIEGGIVLSGHTDVVPVDGQQWDTDPFTLTHKGDKLFGRGTSDMKSFLAVCLALVPHFQSLGRKKPIYLAFSYDEEVGCLGAPVLLAHMSKHIPAPEFVIIGEPTLMQVVTAHKGVLSFETIVHGLEAHSSQPHLGVNAVHYGCDLVHFLRELAREMAHSGKRDERFQPPHTTVHVGVIQGGTARNIIAKECRFVWEIRPLPNDDADAIVARFQAYADILRNEMRQQFKDADIVTRPMSRMTGVTLPAKGERACQHVMLCAHTNQQHAVSFGTEAGVFQDHQIPAIICGPGSIDQAHKPNEWIELSQIDACVEFLLRLTQEEA